MVVEPHGYIHAETQVFTDVTRIVTVRSKTFPTFYARFGDWFVLFCLGIVAFAAYRGRKAANR
jgi:apolipoprotein N-acyltransferase